ncbi:hypothetical protein [Burkholderia pseudomallei]|uniref:hypothetical protein n=1 Tax=Burkholderia pseudomallei TaxID=28450 RepID=UPI00105CEF86|nr:hypothetical protein [Burkholderia pseudomallei]
MKFRLQSLTLALRRDTVKIEFADVSYFWGQMGAGKTSIVRLVDYCLGGNIQLTPAMQNEFEGATLELTLAGGTLLVERPRDADRVIATWSEDGSNYQLTLPARKAEGEVLPGTDVENLSDLLFRLSGIKPPKVRKSKLKEDSDSARLSIRDLLWYCYLDQDEIDSSFFHLDEDAPFYMRNKSRDVLRYVVGFHDERVAELEAQLDQLRGERQALNATIGGLARVLADTGVESEHQIQTRITHLRSRAADIGNQIDSARALADSERQTTHAADSLREQARSLGEELARIDEQCASLSEARERDQRHLHEIETLTLKFRRSVSAKAILTGVEFHSCPRCTQTLPERAIGCCSVCGQTDDVDAIDPTEMALVERDVRARITDLTAVLAHTDNELSTLRIRRDNILKRKDHIERERNEALARYDTAYLSTVIANERERAAFLQEAENLAGFARLPRMLEQQRAQLANIVASEQTVREQLKAARAATQSDTTNLDRLKVLFLDCLVRAGVPGITRQDRVEIPLPSFFPAVYGSEPGDHAVTSFATLSSGGKKTLFKCCFAVAVHRLTAELGAPLPELLIIDSPMKNISERENRTQFEGFYRMLYELEHSEFRGIQLVLIDKEFSAPALAYDFTLIERHMRPADSEFPPLIPYYSGK